MKRKIIASIILCIITMLLFCCACNKQVLDFNQKFDYAIITLNGEVVKSGHIKSWRDFREGDQLQVTFDDGTVILTHGSNIILSTKNISD